jgi:hypothetical protein
MFELFRVVFLVSAIACLYELKNAKPVRNMDTKSFERVLVRSYLDRGSK